MSKRIDLIDNAPAIVFLVAVFVCFVVLGVMAVQVVYESRTLAACLDMGYSSSRTVFPLTGYCIKRVDNTDVVVPVSEVLSHRSALELAP